MLQNVFLSGTLNYIELKIDNIDPLLLRIAIILFISYIVEKKFEAPLGVFEES